ncbi:MAG TPA: DUF2007 domain-containing protein [Bacteroidales bacterium]|jgi:hypothetical protein|nr:DUF2007 domain-containing protein [Bacteroidales bacterium]
MDEKWTMIFSSSDVIKVEILKGLLAAENIESVIINKKDSAYLFGEAELYVPVEDAFEANQIINSSK